MRARVSIASVILAFLVGVFVVMSGVGPVSAQEQPAVVTIADSGDPIANGQALLVAITQATADGFPTTIELTAGRFDLQGNPLVLPGGIDLVGAGDATELCLCGLGDHLFVITGQNGATSIRSVRPVSDSRGLTFFEAVDADVEVRAVTITESFCDCHLKLADVTGGSLTVVDSTLALTADSPFATSGIDISDADVAIVNSAIRVQYAALAVARGPATIADSTLRSYFGTPIFHAFGELVVATSTLSGYDWAMSTGSSDVRISDSDLTGWTEGGIRSRRGSLVTENVTLKVRAGQARFSEWPEGRYEPALDLEGTAGYMSGGSITKEFSNELLDSQVDYGLVPTARTDSEFLFRGVAFGQTTTYDEQAVLSAYPGFSCVGTTLNGVDGAPAGCDSSADSQLGFGIHEVPTVVEAEDYDIASGSASVTFADSDDSNTGTSAYRNDAVDVFNSRSAFGSGFLAGERVVGGTRGGEWTEYTVVSPFDAVYDVGLRLASGSDNPGGVELFVDGASIGAIDITPAQAAGWWSFDEVPIGSVRLAPGRHVLRVLWTGDGAINFDRLSITTDTDIPDFSCEVDRGTVSWTESGRAAYQVFRNGQLLGETAELTFVDTEAVRDAVYEVQYVGSSPQECVVLAEPGDDLDQGRIDWDRIGEIDRSEAGGDIRGGFGAAVDVDAAGDTIVVGSPGFGTYPEILLGQVLVFDQTPEGWVQRGQGIIGADRQHETGTSVAITDDGDTIVVGSIQTTDRPPGFVEVFDWDGVAWVQRGNDLVGPSNLFMFGSETAISADGDTIAVANDQSRVKVFDWDGSVWTERSPDQLGGGGAIAMSADGNTVLIGNSAGRARVFDWSGSAWVGRGSALRGQFGSSVAMSRDGETIVAGGKGFDQAIAFSWSGSAWVQMGDAIGVPGLQYLAPLVATGAEGASFVVSFATETGSFAQSYEWSGAAWMLQGDPVRGHQVAVNGDGSIIVTGAGRSYGDDYGVWPDPVWVYAYPGDEGPGPEPTPTPTPEPTPVPPVGGFACESDGGVLSWSDDGQSKYWTYRSVDGGVSFQWLGKTLGATTLTDPNPVVGARYQVHYRGIPRANCTIVSEPGNASAVPGLIEAEGYDAGPDGWSDSDDVNSGSSDYRSDGVDLYRTRTPGGGFVEGGVTVGQTRGGEWLEYTIQAASAGAFDVSLRLASGAADPGGFEVSIDGVSLGAVDVTPADVSGWWNFADIAAGTAQLDAGTHVVRITFTGNGQLNVDSMSWQ